MVSKTLLAFAISMVTLAHAAYAQPVKIVTYNVASGATGEEWTDRLIDFEAMAKLILDQNPDVVVLQEVHDNWPSARQPRKSQPDHWEDLLGMEGHYKSNANHYNFFGTVIGTAGTMILSRWPIVRIDEDRQASTRSFWLGTVKILGNDKMSVVVDINGKPLRVAAMHFDFKSADTGTLLNNYSTWLEKFPEPRVLAGDANMGADYGGISATTRARYQIFAPDQGIDWVMLRIGSGVELIDGGKVWDEYDHPSDHALVHATVELGVAPPPLPPPPPPAPRCFDLRGKPRICEDL